MIHSLLYVPANQERFFPKAAQCGAGAVILDLEDAVPEDRKDHARSMLAQAVPAVRSPATRVYVRVNNRPDRLADDALAAAEAGADALYIPKVETAGELAVLDKLLEEHGFASGKIGFVPLIESSAGLLEASAIARAPRVIALVAGGEDLATSLGARPTAEVLRIPKLMVHYAAKAAGVLSFGLFRSTVDFRDPDGVRAAALEAREHGFDGASCIHPSIVPILNEVFAPSQEEIAWARKIVAANAAHAAQGIGAFELEGKFIDAPIVARALDLLGKAGLLDEAKEDQ